jgi:hypothetical protein
MSNASILSKRVRRGIWAAVAGAALVQCGAAWAMPRTGEAVVAAQTGQASVRVLTGPVHEGRTEKRDLFEGAAVGESSRVMTGKDGRLCLVLSPGAIVCVAPNTEFTIRQLRHTADGLPKSEDDLIRRIHLQMHKGRIRVQAGAAMPTLDIRIETQEGVVEANGGAFVVAQDGQKRWTIFNDEEDLFVTPKNGDRATLAPGDNARLVLDAEGQAQLDRGGIAIDPDLYDFELCNAFFADLEPFIHSDRPFDRGGLEQYLGLTGPILGIDVGTILSDVSPTLRPSISGTRPAVPPRPGEGEPGGRWEERRIWQWYDDLGPVKGVNYIPRTAVNSVEMWMEKTFDPESIDEELGWAAGIGYNSIRVQLQFAVWQDDPDGFLDRVEKLLEVAAKHGLRVVPVLFDDLDTAGAPPQVGPQPEPIPGEHNSRWVPSPGAEAVKDRNRWPELEQYVKGVMEKFSRDRRVLYWDLYNTAGNSGLWEDSLPLLDQTFIWARAIDPSQPLAVAAWREFGSAMAARKLERSDLITFQSFDNVESVEARLLVLQRNNRPIICSDWLMRQAGNSFEKVLPVFATYRVGWFNQGLVSGKTHRNIQDARYRIEQNPDLWQQDVLQKDGTPYSETEVELIQGFRFLESP